MYALHKRLPPWETSLTRYQDIGSHDLDFDMTELVAERTVISSREDDCSTSRTCACDNIPITHGSCVSLYVVFGYISRVCLVRDIRNSLRFLQQSDAEYDIVPDDDASEVAL